MTKTPTATVTVTLPAADFDDGTPRVVCVQTRVPDPRLAGAVIDFTVLEGVVTSRADVQAMIDTLTGDLERDALMWSPENLWILDSVQCVVSVIALAPISLGAVLAFPRAHAGGDWMLRRVLVALRVEIDDRVFEPMLADGSLEFSSPLPVNWDGGVTPCVLGLRGDPAVLVLMRHEDDHVCGLTVIDDAALGRLLGELVRRQLASSPALPTPGEPYVVQRSELAVAELVRNTSADAPLRALLAASAVH